MTNTTISAPASRNSAVWSRGSFLKEYATRVLRPAEVVILVRYREMLDGTVLELGSGAGRLTGYLAELGADVHGVDLAPSMVAYSNQRYPDAHCVVGDMRDLSAWEDGTLSAVLAPCNVLDVLSDDERRTLLADARRALADDGIIVMSSHNQAFLPSLKKPTHLRRTDPLRFAFDLVRVPRRVRNSRQLVGLEERHDEYAIVNDSAHEYSLLHYYISRDGQEQQFAETGFELLECLDLEGRPVAPGDQAEEFVELHYVARCAPAS
jgi:SAM-dependent methyltransferase